MTGHPTLPQAIAAVPAGAWAVGVSGGADSVALLSLLRSRADISPVVVHLDHQLRGDASTADAAFVADLSSRWNLPCVIARRDEIEPTLSDPPKNPSAKYRAMRMELFRQTIAARELTGVILAHHAGDQAETVLQRLLRGAVPTGLAGMAERTTISDLLVLRPLLRVRHDQLVEHLKSTGQSWREDESNRSDDYLRNRLRRFLFKYPTMCTELLELSNACGELRDWIEGAAPELAEEFSIADLATQPEILARESARRWLTARCVPPNLIDSKVIARLIEMAVDAATSPRRDFPGGVTVARRAGKMKAMCKFD